MSLSQPIMPLFVVRLRLHNLSSYTTRSSWDYNCHHHKSVDLWSHDSLDLDHASSLHRAWPQHPWVCCGQWSSRVYPRSSPAIVTTSYYYIIKSLSSSLVSTTSSILTSAYTIFGDGACFLISGFLKIFVVIQVVKTLSNIVLYIDVKIAGLHKKLSGARWVELVQDNLPLLCLPLSIVCFFATQLLERRMESNAAMHNIWKLDSNCD